MVLKDHGKLILFYANLEDTYAKTPPAPFFLLFPYFFLPLYCKLTIRIRSVDFCFRQKHYLSFKFAYEHENFLYLILQTIDVEMNAEYIF